MGVVCLSKGHRRPTLAAYPDNFGNNQGKLHASYADTLRLVFVSSYTMHTQMHMHTRTCNAHAYACNTRVRKSGCSQSLQPHVLLPSSTPCAPTRAAADGVLVLVLKPPR